MGYEIQLFVRFIEVFLVKILESEGIGCLSIYVIVIGIIVECGYVKFQSNVLVLIFIVFVVISLLEKYFFEFVDVKFIVCME